MREVTRARNRKKAPVASGRSPAPARPPQAPEIVARKVPRGPDNSKACRPWVCKAIPKQQSLWSAGEHSIVRPSIPCSDRPGMTASSDPSLGVDSRRWLRDREAAEALKSARRPSGDRCRGSRDSHEALAVWMLEEEPDPTAGTVFHVGYAHRVCEERFLEELPGPEYREVATKRNLEPFRSWSTRCENLRRPNVKTRKTEKLRGLLSSSTAPCSSLFLDYRPYFAEHFCAVGRKEVFHTERGLSITIQGVVPFSADLHVSLSQSSRAERRACSVASLFGSCPARFSSWWGSAFRS